MSGPTTIESYETDGITVLTSCGELIANNPTELKSHLLSIIARGDIYFIVDLRDANRITSTGQSVLCSIHQQLQSKQGWIRLVCTDPVILEIFCFTGLADVFEIYETVEEAVAAK